MKKASVFRWLLSLCVVVRIKPLTRPGLEESASDIGETAHSENGGHPSGQFESELATVASLKLRAIADLNQALSSLILWQEVERGHKGVSIVEDLRALLNRVNGN